MFKESPAFTGDPNAERLPSPLTAAQKVRARRNGALWALFGGLVTWSGVNSLSSAGTLIFASSLLNTLLVPVMGAIVITYGTLMTIKGIVQMIKGRTAFD